MKITKMQATTRSLYNTLDSLFDIIVEMKANNSNYEHYKTEFDAIHDELSTRSDRKMSFTNKNNYEDDYDEDYDFGNDEDYLDFLLYSFGLQCRWKTTFDDDYTEMEVQVLDGDRIALTFSTLFIPDAHSEALAEGRMVLVKHLLESKQWQTLEKLL